MICFHHNDLDGRCCAAILRYRFDDSVRMYEINYNMDFPLHLVAQGEDVFLVDFTPQRTQFERVVETANRTVWIDHHWSAVSKFQNMAYLPGLRTNTKPAACYLTWQWAFPDRSIPKSVFLISKFDTWDFEEGDQVEHFMHGMRGYDSTPQASIWDVLLRNSKNAELISRIQQEGKAVGRAFKYWSRDYYRAFGYECEWEGYHCIVCNVAMLGSKFFDLIKQTHDHDIMVSYVHDGNGFSVSLHSEDPDINVSTIAVGYGGGGHPGAAGFQCKKLPFRPEKDD